MINYNCELRHVLYIISFMTRVSLQIKKINFLEKEKENIMAYPTLFFYSKHFFQQKKYRVNQSNLLSETH
jgi:hypothetical protein